MVPQGNFIDPDDVLMHNDGKSIYHNFMDCNGTCLCKGSPSGQTQCDGFKWNASEWGSESLRVTLRRGNLPEQFILIDEREEREMMKRQWCMILSEPPTQCAVKRADCAHLLHKRTRVREWCCGETPLHAPYDLLLDNQLMCFLLTVNTFSCVLKLERI